MVHGFQQRRSKSTDALPSHSTQETVIHVYSRGNGCFVLIRLCHNGSQAARMKPGLLTLTSPLPEQSGLGLGLQRSPVTSAYLQGHTVGTHLTQQFVHASAHRRHIQHTFPKQPSWLGVSGPLRTLHIRSQWCFALQITVIFCTSNYNGVFRIKLHWSVLK